MGLPVKRATQPALLLKNRSAQNEGADPMSNQCLVPAGTWIRSPCSQRTKRTSSLIWREQPLAFHEEANFVFGVDVFRQEFAAKR